MTPLALSDPTLLQPDPADRWLDWFPILGWFIGGTRQMMRTRQAQDEVRRQLKQRENFPSSAWVQAGHDAAKAEAIARALQSRLTYLPNHYFLPNDPLQLLWLDWEGIGHMEAAFAVRQKLGVRLPLTIGREAVVFSGFVSAVEVAPPAV